MSHALNSRLPRRLSLFFYTFVLLAVVGLLVAPISFFKLLGRVSRASARAQVQAESDLIRPINLSANDVAYSPLTKMLYVSVPSSAGAKGNSITQVNPQTGEIGSPVFIGSEPNKLAISDDGQTLYAAVEGASAIRKFDVTSQTAGPQFSLGQDPSFGFYSANDIAVAPGNPNVVAIARYYRGVSPPEAGVAIFDNGVQRPKTGAGHIAGSDYIAYSASASTLYGGGTTGGLRTMTIDNTGVSSTATTGSFSIGIRVKFDNGLVFSSSGQVINPDTSTLLGTFANANSNAFVVDSAAGRAYYVIGNQFGGTNATVTLQAYDIKTFVPVGSLTITGVNGSPTNLIRWGSNGLALRTSGNQLFIIQTSLIPSSDPIPTPTPTPSPSPTPTPSPVAAFISQVALTTNALVYNQTTQKLYASIPSSVGSKGNSITTIDPLTGSVGTPVFVGSEPTKLALSDDGQSLYVALDGAGAVRRFNTVSGTAEQQFSIGLDSFFGVYSISDIAVAPGNPNVVAVARYYKGSSPPEAGVAVFENGVQRQKTGPDHNSGSDYLAFSASASTLYGNNTFPGFSVLSVDNTGVTVARTSSFARTTGIRFDNGLIYGSSGQVLNPDTGALVGTFSVQPFGSAFFEPIFTTDSANRRAFFLVNLGSAMQLRVYDMDTFLLVGSLDIKEATGIPSNLVRWGANGLAFRTNSGRVFIIQTSLVNPSEPVPAPTPTPSPSPSASPSPPYIPTFVRKVGLPANDIVYNQSTQTIYASVPSRAGSIGNSITEINPQTGAIGTSTFVGSEPNRLALADDASTLYVSLDGAQSVRRFDIPTRTPGLQFSTGIQQPADMDVMPGSPQSIAISDGTNTGISIYDNGVRRTNASKGTAYGIGAMEFGASASTLYGTDGYSSAFELVKFTVDATGVKAVSTTNGLGSGFGSGLKFVNGLLYTSSGRVVDPEAKTLAGTFQSTNFGTPAMAVDASAGRVFFIRDEGNGIGLTLSAYDMNTYVPLGSVSLPGISGTPTTLVRWGVNGLALRTAPLGIPGSANDAQVYLLQTELVSKAAPIPTGLQFSASNYVAFEGSNTSVTITVTRMGDISGTTTVDYSTGGGTATERSDYVGSSGTLNFAPGETKKTFSVILIDNAYSTGDRTVNLTLSNVSGGVLVTPVTAVLTIHDNDVGTPSFNPIDQAQFFVQQHYFDFLNRTPDSGGLSYWTSQITQCGTDQNCINSRRVGVSAAYFIELEFQDTGSYVYRFYKASYGQQPTYSQFMPDRSQVVAGSNLEASKQSFAESFVQRGGFISKYPTSLGGPDFIAALVNTVKQGSAVDLSIHSSELLDQYNQGSSQTNSRARTLRKLIEYPEFKTAEYNRAFVLMQYFGYLRRDADSGGYQFWLDVLNNKLPNDSSGYRSMVCAFLTSAEYQQRFSPVVTRNDHICGSINQ